MTSEFNLTETAILVVVILQNYIMT